MAQSKSGAKKAVITTKLRRGEDFYKRIGYKSGKTKNPNKGFGSDREKARLAGLKSAEVRKAKRLAEKGQQNG